MCGCVSGWRKSEGVILFMGFCAFVGRSHPFSSCVLWELGRLHGAYSKLDIYKLSNVADRLIYLDTDTQVCVCVFCCSVYLCVCVLLSRRFPLFQSLPC